MNIIYKVKLPRKLKKLAKNLCFSYMNARYNTDGGWVYIHAADYSGVIWTQSPNKLSDDEVLCRHGKALFETQYNDTTG